MEQVLRSDHPENLPVYACFTGQDIPWRPWEQLIYSVKTGMPALHYVFLYFDYFWRNPEVAAFFDEAMTSISAMEARAASEGVRVQRNRYELFLEVQVLRRYTGKLFQPPINFMESLLRSMLGCPEEVTCSNLAGRAVWSMDRKHADKGYQSQSFSPMT